MHFCAILMVTSLNVIENGVEAAIMNFGNACRDAFLGRCLCQFDLVVDCGISNIERTFWLERSVVDRLIYTSIANETSRFLSKPPFVKEFYLEQNGIRNVILVCGGFTSVRFAGSSPAAPTKNTTCVEPVCVFSCFHPCRPLPLLSVYLLQLPGQRKGEMARRWSG